MALAVVSLFVAAPGFAAPEPATGQSAGETRVPVKDGKFAGGKRHHGHAMFSFTDEQKEKVYQLKNQLSDSIGPKRLELKKQQRALRELLSQEKIDRGAVSETQSKINGLRSEISNAMLNFRVEFAEQLTPEQRKKLRYSSMGGGKHFHGGFKRGGGRGC